VALALKSAPHTVSRMGAGRPIPRWIPMRKIDSNATDPPIFPSQHDPHSRDSHAEDLDHYVLPACCMLDLPRHSIVDARSYKLVSVQNAANVFD
jgi:hypothetical protein